MLDALDGEPTPVRDWCIGARTLFGVDRGDAMHELVKEQWGNPCPCTAGLPCPILPPPKPDPAHHWDAAVATMDAVPLSKVTHG